MLDALDLPKPEHFWFTAKNGKRIHSVIFFPPQLDRSKKYPLIVIPHGGPNTMDSDTFSTRWNSHLLTSPGYVLVQTNYTGSTGFGEKFADDIERDVLRGPALEDSRRGAGSDQALSVHRRDAAGRDRRQLRRLPDELVQRSHRISSAAW